MLVGEELPSQSGSKRGKISVQNWGSRKSAVLNCKTYCNKTVQNFAEFWEICGKAKTKTEDEGILKKRENGYLYDFLKQIIIFFVTKLFRILLNSGKSVGI